jgi:hypothetical protein
MEELAIIEKGIIFSSLLAFVTLLYVILICKCAVYLQSG